MWGRYVGKTAACGAVLLGTALFFDVCLTAQELPDAVVRMIERQCEDGGGDPEALTLYFLDLMDRPMDISSAGRDELEAFPLMTPFMVESLLEYREEFGPPASVAELSLVDGFDAVRVKEMLPFIVLGHQEGRNTGDRMRLSGRWMVRSRWKAVRGTQEDGDTDGWPIPLLTKMKADLGGRYSVGLVLETDVGEIMFPDFYSMYLSAEDISLSADGRFNLVSAVVGDYSLRFGQGLVLWNSFSMSGLSSPASVLRKEAAVRPYWSVDENRYFHGAGVTMEVPGNVELSLFYSDNGHDARIEDGYFVTMPDDGIHDSEADVKARNALREYVTGGNVSWRCGWAKVGVTVAAYRYSCRDGRRKSYYNSHLRYDGWWGNASVDFMFSLNGYRIFGETALDRDIHPAVIAGAVLPLRSDMEMSVLYRYYSKDYIATHAGAYCRSNCNNEHGLSTALRWTPVADLAVSGSLEYTRYPFSRFGVREPSGSLKGALDCEWTLSDIHTLYLKLSGTYDNGRDTRLFRLRTQYSCRFMNGLQFVTRAEMSHDRKTGFLFYQEAGYSLPSDKLKCVVRATFFYAPDWATRIYCYERDVPGAFSVPAFYGKGAGLYAMVTYKPVRWISLSLKCSASKYSDRDDDSLGLRFQLTVPF